MYPGSSTIRCHLIFRLDKLWRRLELFNRKQNVQWEHIKMIGNSKYMYLHSLTPYFRIGGITRNLQI